MIYPDGTESVGKGDLLALDVEGEYAVEYSASFGSEKFTERKVRVKFVAEGELTGMSLNLDTFTGLVEDKQSYPLVNVVVNAKADDIVQDFMNTLFDKRVV